MPICPSCSRTSTLNCVIIIAKSRVIRSTHSYFNDMYT
uniref:Uncharacterized protein n=1 Tax=Arundo donax TaxID=35708 RepID=A0A0A9DSP9_ARUDO